VRFIDPVVVPPVPISETLVAPATKPVPVIVTGTVDPAVADDGLMEVTVGCAEQTVTPVIKTKRTVRLDRIVLTATLNLIEVLGLRSSIRRQRLVCWHNSSVCASSVPPSNVMFGFGQAN